MSIPVDATHVVADIHDVTEHQKIMNGKHPYRKKEGNDWFAFVDGEWLNVWFSESHRYQRLNKPWSGPEDGLPPIGGRVDYMGEHCTVVAHVMERNEKGAILQGADDWFYGTEITIDPIRTAADIAAEKRETAIRELMDIAQVDCRVTAARLVDAGFKR